MTAIALSGTSIAGVFFAITTCALWALSFVSPVILEQFSPYAVTLGRYGAFGLISVAIVPFAMRHLRALDTADWAKAAWLSFVGNMAYYLLLATAIQLSDVPGPTVVMGLLPLTVPIFANLRKQELPWRTIFTPLLGIAAGGGQQADARVRLPGHLEHIAVQGGVAGSGREAAATHGDDPARVGRARVERPDAHLSGDRDGSVCSQVVRPKGAALHAIPAEYLAACSLLARRRAVERRAAEMARRHMIGEGCDDLGAILHEEIDALPGRYGQPIVLCDLEGCTYDEAAASLLASAAPVTAYPSSPPSFVTRHTSVYSGGRPDPADRPSRAPTSAARRGWPGPRSRRSGPARSRTSRPSRSSPSRAPGPPSRAPVHAGHRAPVAFADRLTHHAQAAERH